MLYEAFKSVRKSMKEARNKGISNGGITWNIEFVLCSDMIATLCVMGVKHVSGEFSCAWCTASQEDRGKLKNEAPNCETNRNKL